MKNSASSEQDLYIKRLKKHQKSVLFIQIFLLIFLIALWEIASDMGWINSFIFSSPSRMLRSGIDLMKNGRLLIHRGITLAETFASFFLVAMSSILIAVLLWWNHTLSEILEPYFVI